MNQNIINIIELFTETDLFYESLKTGDITLLHRIQVNSYKSAKHRCFCCYETSAYYHAALNGHLDMVKWLHENNYHDQRKAGAITGAAAGGHLHVVKWLYDDRLRRYGKVYSKNAMILAAENGHLEVLKFLHAASPCRKCSLCRKASLCPKAYLCRKKDSEKCSTDAMDRAAANGHLEIVKWLDACISNA